MRQALLSLAITLAAAAWGDRPNVLLIVADDLGWKDVGFMGSSYYETPNLDRLAREGMTFTQAYAAAANCAPSRACLMSGQQTPRHGIYTVGSSERGEAETRRLIPTPNTETLANHFDTIAEALGRSGYQSCSIGKWHLGDDPRSQGFDKNVAGNHRGSPAGGYFVPYKNPNLADGPIGENLTDRLALEAIAYLDQRDKGKPFFLYLPYFAVHTPLQAKEELLRKYQAKTPQTRQGKPVYAAMVETLDTSIGRILQYLDNHDLSEETLVIFTSDNGGIAAVSSQAPLRGGKGSYYEGGIRVPTVARWPGQIEAKAQNATPITNLDFYPTLVELLDLPHPDIVFDGISLAPALLENERMPDRTLVWHFPIYLQAYNPKKDDSRDPLFRTRPGSVARLGKWKLHHYFEDDAYELYNLESDLGERINLAESDSSVLALLKQELANWRDEFDAPVPAKPNPEYSQGAELAALGQALAK